MNKQIKQAIFFLTPRKILWILIVFIVFIFIYNLLQHLKMIEGYLKNGKNTYLLKYSNPVSRVVIDANPDAPNGSYLHFYKLELYDTSNRLIPYIFKKYKNNNTTKNTISDNSENGDGVGGWGLNNFDSNKFFHSLGGKDTLTIELNPPQQISKIYIKNREMENSGGRLGYYSLYLYDAYGSILTQVPFYEGDSPELNTLFWTGPGDATLYFETPDNYKGPQGNKGPVGYQGNKGPDGPQGNKGPNGPQGNQGPQGKGGPTGPRGDPGIQGNPGIQGQSGIQGVTGPVGPPRIIRHSSF